MAAIDTSTFLSDLGISTINTAATNQYEFYKGIVWSDASVTNDQYEFYQKLKSDTYRYGFYKTYTSEYSFYTTGSGDGFTDTNIVDFYTFYKYTAAAGVTPAIDEFIMVIDTTLGGTADTFAILPMNGTDTYNVDWGDGFTQTAVTGDQVRTYASGGVYTIEVSGNFPGYRMYDNAAYKLKLTDITNWGIVPVKTFLYAYYGCNNLTISATDAPNLSGVTIMEGIFGNCKALTNEDFSAWDTSSITDMSSAFTGCDLLSTPNFTGWNTSLVTEMDYMFADCPVLQADLSGFDTSEVVKMRGMFQPFSNPPPIFNQDITGWNTSKVTDFNSMFRAAGSFNQDIGNWDTSSATDMTYMFFDATTFNQDLTGWCVTLIGSLPAGFNGGTSALTAGNLPVWGTCP